MKKKHFFLKPFLFIMVTALGAFLWQQNYNIQRLEPQIGKAIVSKKYIKPAGSTQHYRKVGNKTIAYNSVNIEEPTLLLNFKNRKVKVIVSIKEYKQINVKDTVGVCYYNPKILGKSFNFYLKN